MQRPKPSLAFVTISHLPTIVECSWRRIMPRRMMQICTYTLIAAVLVTLGTGCPRSNSNVKDGAQTTKINAGGATFIYPMMSKWADEYNKAKGIQVAYASSGSGTGINQMIEKTLDFGCSDAPLTPEQMKKA